MDQLAEKMHLCSPSTFATIAALISGVSYARLEGARLQPRRKVSRTYSGFSRRANLGQPPLLATFPHA